MPRLLNLTGQQFGFLTVLSRAGIYRTVATWNCCCSCGEQLVVRGDQLRKGTKLACARNGHRWNSGREPWCRTYPAEHRIWERMRERCRNPNKQGFHNYGGRGISVCERWNLFDNFINDMGSRPSSKHTIERKNVNGNYEPVNCRWATISEQSKNRRNSVYVVYEGRREFLADLAARFGKTGNCVYGRLRIGWTLEAALKTPVHKRVPRPEKPSYEDVENSFRESLQSMCFSFDELLA